ncbi:hypothetical protein SLE2022_283410 [Rubroshorea leprosula]
MGSSSSSSPSSPPSRPGTPSSHSALASSPTSCSSSSLSSRHPRLLPPLQQLLHLPQPNPLILDMVPLHLPSEVPVRSRSTERIRRPNKMLRQRSPDV